MHHTSQKFLGDADIDGFISIKEVCNLTKAARATIWRWQQNKEFPPSVRIGPRKVGVSKAEYRAWCAARKAALADSGKAA